MILDQLNSLLVLGTGKQLTTYLPTLSKVKNARCIALPTNPQKFLEELCKTEA